MWWNERQEYYYDPYGGNEELHNDGCGVIVLWVVIGALCALLGSCKTEYVPIETVRTEYHHTRDSIHHTDSVIKEKQVTIMQLDSEAMAQYGIQLESAEKAWLVLQKELESKIRKLMEHKTDSFVKTDTIRVPMPVVTKVRWQDKAAYIGIGIVLSLIIIIVSVIVVKILRARSRI